jgi:hypothetical protein
MELHQVLGITMMEIFGLVVVSKIRERVQEIRAIGRVIS